MDIRMEWCSFCDAVLRSGAWVANIDGAAEWACPECGAGWDRLDTNVVRSAATG